MKHLAGIVCLGLWFSACATAQTGTISGTVVNEKGEVLSHAQVFVSFCDEWRRGVLTDMDGKYSMEIPLKPDIQWPCKGMGYMLSVAYFEYRGQVKKAVQFGWTGKIKIDFNLVPSLSSAELLRISNAARARDNHRRFKFQATWPPSALRNATAQSLQHPMQLLQHPVPEIPFVGQVEAPRPYWEELTASGVYKGRPKLIEAKSITELLRTTSNNPMESGCPMQGINPLLSNPEYPGSETIILAEDLEKMPY